MEFAVAAPLPPGQKCLDCDDKTMDYASQRCIACHFKWIDSRERTCLDCKKTADVSDMAVDEKRCPECNYKWVTSHICFICHEELGEDDDPDYSGGSDCVCHKRGKCITEENKLNNEWFCIVCEEWTPKEGYDQRFKACAECSEDFYGECHNCKTVMAVDDMKIAAGCPPGWCDGCFFKCCDAPSGSKGMTKCGKCDLRATHPLLPACKKHFETSAWRCSRCAAVRFDEDMEQREHTPSNPQGVRICKTCVKQEKECKGQKYCAECKWFVPDDKFIDSLNQCDGCANKYPNCDGCGKLFHKMDHREDDYCEDCWDKHVEDEGKVPKMRCSSCGNSVLVQQAEKDEKTGLPYCSDCGRLDFDKLAPCFRCNKSHNPDRYEGSSDAECVGCEPCIKQYQRDKQIYATTMNRKRMMAAEPEPTQATKKAKTESFFERSKF